MTKSIEEQIAENERRIQQIKERNRQLKRRQSEQERKARTKSLIEVGARVEQATGMTWRKQDDWDEFTRALHVTVSLSDGTKHTVADIIHTAYKRIHAVPHPNPDSMTTDKTIEPRGIQPTHHAAHQKPFRDTDRTQDLIRE